MFVSSDLAFVDKICLCVVVRLLLESTIPGTLALLVHVDMYMCRVHVA